LPSLRRRIGRESAGPTLRLASRANAALPWGGCGEGAGRNGQGAIVVSVRPHTPCSSDARPRVGYCLACTHAHDGNASSANSTLTHDEDSQRVKPAQGGPGSRSDVRGRDGRTLGPVGLGQRNVRMPSGAPLPSALRRKKFRTPSCLSTPSKASNPNPDDRFFSESAPMATTERVYIDWASQDLPSCHAAPGAFAAPPGISVAGIIP
jgi:hypothetical protein